MEKQNWLINLGIIGLLWFALGFACNNGSSRSGSRTTSYDTGRKTTVTQSTRDDDDDETAAQSTRQNTDGELTEQDVRDYFTNYHMKGCDELYECRVTFDTPIEIGSVTRRNIQGGLPGPEGGLAVAYPVNVDVSFYKRDIGLSSDKGQWSHYKGGTHYFYRDVNRIWNDAQVGVDFVLGN